MNWEIFSWILVTISLTGNIFVIKKHVIGQWLWATANLGWISYNIVIGANAQAFLFTVYFGICVWGIFAWSKDHQTEKSKKLAEV